MNRDKGLIMADRYSRTSSPSSRRYGSPSVPGNHGVSGSSHGSSGTVSGTVRSLPPSGSSSRKGQMQSLLGEFKGLYEGKLKRLDDADKAGEETSKMRVRVLQSYVNDLSEQNEVLVQTVEELEREANERVAMLEDKLQRTSSGKLVLGEVLLVL
ncbi:uncharacterized protein LOC118478143 [Aplysia californica]|uniref:Uncharacterized protein LOC118478143 n=1 Tax=Aplysia californica TaxID=6500 RepID=A0ABM1VX53_APLCA|nr:uncharacterized protein LOC118478143 [Aplysia californica]